MNFTDAFHAIIQRWTELERYDLIKEIEDAPHGAPSGTEGLFLIMSYIKHIKEKDFESYQEIEMYVAAIIEDLKTRGIYFKI